MGNNQPHPSQPPNPPVPKKPTAKGRPAPSNPTNKTNGNTGPQPPSNRTNNYPGRPDSSIKHKPKPANPGPSNQTNESAHQGPPSSNNNKNPAQKASSNPDDNKKPSKKASSNPGDNKKSSKKASSDLGDTKKPSKIASSSLGDGKKAASRLDANNNPSKITSSNLSDNRKPLKIASSIPSKKKEPAQQAASNLKTNMNPTQNGSSNNNKKPGDQNSSNQNTKTANTARPGPSKQNKSNPGRPGSFNRNDSNAGRPGPADWRDKSPRRPGTFQRNFNNPGRPGPSNWNDQNSARPGSFNRNNDNPARPRTFNGNNNDNSSLQGPPKQPCFTFQRTGDCPFGSRCRYSHEPSSHKGVNNSNPPNKPRSHTAKTPEASEDVSRFLASVQGLARRGGVPRLRTENDVQMWRAAWTAIAIGASNDMAPDLLTLLLRLPASSSVAPGGQEVLKVCLGVVRSLTRKKKDGKQVVRDVQTVADVVKGRLVGRGGVGRGALEVVEEIKVNAHMALMAVMQDMRWVKKAGEVLGVVMSALERLAGELERAEEEVEDEELVGTEVGWMGWQKPTLEWLMGGEWLNARPLDMKYRSLGEYADTLREMVTMLGFYWGAGAVFPKCRVKGKDDKSCDQPMLVKVVGAGRVRCGSRIGGRAGCNSVPVWRCSRRGHDGICAGCLKKTQTLLIGAPGSRASTDVYDAVVERETVRRGGLVYVSGQLASRKPPSVEPNWRTTYRLNCSALVGVVRLSASCEPLQRKAKIDWAEVVAVHPQEGFGDDYVERQRGRLAIRLLGRADLSSLDQDAEALQVGQRIAIIDMRVFVPEVVSIVSALTDQGLNEHLSNISFAPRLIGADKRAEKTALLVENDVDTAIRSALEVTEIEVFTRLPELYQQIVIRKITGLVKAATLDGAQLAAFSGALSNSVHCTQGPPGTGKSYLGVIVIRALDIIRVAALEAKMPVGPIVVLSYKNHSLDEVLIDVMESKQIGTELIRCGKPEDERLQQFTEKRSYQEYQAQDVLMDRVKCLRASHRFARDILVLRSAFFENRPGAVDEWIPVQKDSRGLDAAVRRIMQILRLRCSGVGMEEKRSAESAYSALDMMNQKSERITPSEQRLILGVISGLSNDMEHWITEGDCRVKFLLENWLSGEEPPPRCAASKEDGCFLQSDAHGAYCELLHKCLHQSGCKARRSRGTYCSDHACVHDGNECVLPRILNSKVCAEHACGMCVRLGSVEILGKTGKSCENHSCRDPLCDNEYIATNIPFCVSHSCQLCQYVASENPQEVKSVRCVEGSRFCAEHKCRIRGCVNERNTDLGAPQNFCIRHSCIACDGTRRRVDEQLPESRLCVEHRCSHVDSERILCDERILEDSLFCQEHTCRFCRAESGLVVKPVVGISPRNVCAGHPICANMDRDGGTCNNRIYGRSQYCDQHLRRGHRLRRFADDHGIVMRCSGIAKRTKKRCKAKGPSVRGRFFCPPHYQQRSDSESSDEEGGGGAPSDFLHSSSTDNMMPITRIPGELGQDVEPSPGRQELEDHSPKEDNGERPDQIMAAEYLDETDAHGETTETRERSDANMDLAVDQVTVNPPLEDAGVFAPSSHAHEKDSSVEAVGKGNKAGNNMEIPVGSTGERTEAGTAELPSKNEGRGEDSGTETEASDGPAFGTCPDELDLSSEESSDEDVGEEISDNLQHLRDIAGEESTDDSDTEDDDQTADVPLNEVLHEGAMENLSDWCWGMPLPDRYKLVADFLGGAYALTTSLAAIADAYMETARRDLAEAAAFTFKQARVIGATVVGATRRLEALRACEPFAMLVEEACEVMEPTLVSVLAVRSLQKLEMIGDHRQLPAFVQPCWFNLQTTHPSIKVSLFERLLTSDSSICSVLDVQRRMRPEISELTRCEYEDVVQIIDHDSTKSQRVADRFGKALQGWKNVGSVKKVEAVRELWRAKKGAKVARVEAVRESWSEKGMAVPGIRPQVFFWDLDSREGRAAVGLSRCNLGESKACVALVEWLVRCGVPSSCISILSPFKGQKLTILKDLRGLSTRLNVKGVIVSTVDKYQGDENDIVILSLVSTRPGNLFVALRNRFIVATSRARLGFYIVGSSGALIKNAQGGDGPTHWLRFLADLGHAASAGTEVESNASPEARIGRSLTICCPRHVVSVRGVSCPGDFPRSEKELSAFCNEPCSYALPWCGHYCDLKCHGPEVSHTGSCQVLLARPCESHSDVPLPCYKLKSLDESGSQTLADALQSFKCDVRVQYPRPECPHIVDLSCFQQHRLLSGDVELPECSERVEDFVNPSCGHRHKKPTCADRRQWEVSAPLCKKTVIHHRPCGCKTSMTCDDSIKEASLETPSLCREAVEARRPRCSHSISLRCHEGTTLRELWNEQDGESVTLDAPVVRFGVRYGPSETELGVQQPNRLNKQFSQCFVKTSYSRSCGHDINVLCSDAFLLASGSRQEPPCRQPTITKSPLCGHEISVACNALDMVGKLAPSVFVHREDSKTGQSESIADEGTLLDADVPQVLQKFKNACAGRFVVMRKCGHKTTPIHCARLYSLLTSKKIPVCKTEVAVKRSCGHPYNVPCHRRRDPPPVCRHPVDDIFVYPSCRHGHTIRPGTCDQLETLKASENPQCPVIIHCPRFRCSHVVEVECHLERRVTSEVPGHRVAQSNGRIVVDAFLNYCEAATGVGDCMEPVTFRRHCGHEEKDVPCFRAFEWAADPDTAVRCRVPIIIDSTLCQHPVEVECSLRDSVRSADPWGDAIPSRITTALDGGDDLTCPVIVQDKNKPSWSSIFTELRCGRKSRIRRVCGHEDDVPCELIFEALRSKCERVEQMLCASCGHEKPVSCQELTDNRQKILCHNIVEKQCSLCNINAAKVECCLEKCVCREEVSFVRQCGHSVKWICGEEDDPRTKPDEYPCLVCLRDRWNEKLVVARTIREAVEIGKVSETDLLRQAAELLGFSSRSLLEDLRARINGILPSEVIVNREDIEQIVFESLLTAYLDILEVQLDLLSKALEGDGNSELSYREPPELGSSECYDIVWTGLDADRKAEESLGLVEGQYGFGVRTKLLSLENLKSVVNSGSETGAMSICVGAAFRHQASEGLKPFRDSSDEMKRRVKEKRMKRRDVQRDRAQANMLAMRFVESGFDYATTEQSDERVYWVAGSVFPLMQMQIQLTVGCMICLDGVVPVKAWECSNGHVICRECFVMQIDAAKQPGSIGRIVDRDGNMLCPQVGCGVKYEALQLISQKHDASEEELRQIHTDMEEMRTKARSAREIKAALEQQRQKMQAEFQRIQSIQDLDERQAQTLRMEIIENILTLRCPRKDCRMAFFDFEGCFALSCGNKDCRTYFCAWCLTFKTNSNNEIHAHVRRCPEGRGGLFYDFETFEKHHRRRAKRLVLEKLKGIDRSVRTRALKRVEKELTDLGIRIREDDF